MLNDANLMLLMARNEFWSSPMPLTSKLMDQQGNVCVYLRTVVIDVLWRLFTWQIYASGRDSKECI